jgi:hypothetical protein
MLYISAGKNQGEITLRLPRQPVAHSLGIALGIDVDRKGTMSDETPTIFPALRYRDANAAID